jgi:hypothetical protein
MTAPQDEYQKKLKLFQEHLVAAARSADMLKDIYGRLVKKYPFKIEDVENLHPDVGIIVYALFKKFEQLVVLMNDNIFKNIPYFEMENTAKMYRYDFAVYAEKLGIVKSAKTFANAVALRNQLAHEYPLNAEKQTALINNVIVESEVLLQTVPELQRFVESRLPVWSQVRKQE